MFFEFDDFDVRERFFSIEEKVQRLKHLLQSKPPEFSQHFGDMCTRAYVLHDSALDGQVITGEDIHSAFNSQVRPSTFKNRAMQEIRNHRKLYHLLCSSQEDLRSEDKIYQSNTVRFEDVVQLHNELYDCVGKREQGQFRKIIPLHGTYLHELSEPAQIRSKLQDLCRQTEHPEFRAQHPINQAVIFHRQFMQVFPFSEGSGKIGRLYMNNFLKQGGYGPVIIHGSERQRYYESLRDGQEHLREFLLDSMESALDSQHKYIREIA